MSNPGGIEPPTWEMPLGKKTRKQELAGPGETKYGASAGLNSVPRPTHTSSPWRSGIAWSSTQHLLPTHSTLVPRVPDTQVPSTPASAVDPQRHRAAPGRQRSLCTAILRVQLLGSLKGNLKVVPGPAISSTHFKPDLQFCTLGSIGMGLWDSEH